MSSAQKIIQAAAGNAAGGATYVEDVFSTYLYTGNGGTQHIENGIALTDTNSGGSVEFDGTGEWLIVPETSSEFTFGTGDFTIETWFNTSSTALQVVTDWRSAGGSQGAMPSIYINGSTLYYYRGTDVHSTSISLNQWYHVAIVRNSGTLTMYLNGVSVGSGADTNTYIAPQDGNIRIGAINATNDFIGYISNFRVVKGTAVYTSAFTPSTTPLTDVSGTSLLTCQGDTPLVDNSSNAHTITVNGNAKAKAFGPFTSDTEGEGGLVWIKRRDDTRDHILYDTERGTGGFIGTNLTAAEENDPDSVTNFNSNGFSLGADGDVNFNGWDFVSWTFRKAPKFFDVVTYTGNATSGRTISHNLGSVPGCIIVKKTDNTSNWAVYHRGNTASPETDYLRLNTTNATTDDVSIWNDTAPTDSVFTVGNGGEVNSNNASYVAYLFAHNDGDGGFGENADQDIIKCGSFTSSGQEIDLGFEPQWLLFKATNTSNNWSMFDTMRGFTADTGTNARLRANTTDAEGTNTSYGVTSTGFVDNLNDSNTYIYIAIRRGPMKTPESGTEVFALEYETGSGTVENPVPSGFPVDAYLFRAADLVANNVIYSRLTGDSKYLYTNSTSAELSTYSIQLDHNDKVVVGVPTGNIWNGTGGTFARYMFRRAPGFFDVVTYEGDGVAGLTVNHNLGVAPEMMIIKHRGGYDWLVYHQGIGNSNYLRLNAVNGATSTTHFNSTTPTESVFTVGDNAAVNGSGSDYIVYLFATVPGISKVGTYTGNGTGQTIDCGFSAGARFVLIKRTDGNSNWNVYDTERGIVAGNDPRLELDSTDAEDTGSDDVDPDSSGFAVTSDAFVNTSGASYAFLAIA